MTTATITFESLDHLRDLMLELHGAGRVDEAASVALAHAALQEIYIRENFPGLDDDDDPEFISAMEAADRDIAEGRTIPHEDVMRQLMGLADA